MRNTITIYFLAILVLALFSCNGKSSSTPTNNTATPASNPAVATANALPSITLAEMQILYDQCDYIDFIFYNMDFSMSVNDKSNVQRVVTFVDKSTPNPNLTCPTMGRIIFQNNGEILIEADMHYDKDCQHLVFFKDNKKVYANNLSDQGKAYFQQMFSKVKLVPTQ